MPNGAGVMEGDEVSEYIAPFAFVVNEDGTDLDYTTGTRVHDIMALIYKQNNGRVCFMAKCFSHNILYLLGQHDG